MATKEDMGFSSERGQVLLIVVLVMVVALTVGLALAARTITNLRTSTDEESSQRAFAAAEAGVERLLKATTTNQIQNAKLGDAFIKDAKILQQTSPSFILNAGNQIEKSDAVDVWLSDYPSFTNQWNGILTIYWDTPGSSCPNEAAIEIAMMYGDPSDPQTVKYPVDPCSRGNGFYTPYPGGGGTVDGVSFPQEYRVTVPPSPGGIFVRIIPYYESALVAVSGGSGNPLPSQGKTIESIGTAGDTERKIRVFQGYPRIPVEFFPHILFSTKQ